MSALPRVHYRAFVRTLAGALGLDADALLDALTPEQEPAASPAIEPAAALPAPSARKLLFGIGALAAVALVTLAVLYAARGPQLFTQPSYPAEPVEGGWPVLTDTLYTAMQGLWTADTVNAPATVPQTPQAPAKPRLSGKVSPEALFKAYPVYGRLRDQYLPNAVTLSRLEALKPSLTVEVYFSPDDTLARRLVPPLLQIRRAAYLPDMRWTLYASERRQGQPLIVIRQDDEVLVRWNRQVDQRLEATLLDIANVADRRKTAQEGSPS